MFAMTTVKTDDVAVKVTKAQRRADVLVQLRDAFQTGRVTRKELKAFVKTNGMAYPRFITKDKARRAGAGVYSLALRPAASRVKNGVLAPESSVTKITVNA